MNYKLILIKSCLLDDLFHQNYTRLIMFSNIF